LNASSSCLILAGLRVHKIITSGTCGIMQPSWKGLQAYDIRN
jgi:nucleoside phosphorylase